MAGHFPLSEINEPKIFKKIKELRKQIAIHGSTVKNFEKFKVTDKNKSYEVMKLSPEYVENPKTERAFTVGKFSLESITDEHPSITQNISLEVHLIVDFNSVKIKDIFWVA